MSTVGKTVERIVEGYFRGEDLSELIKVELEEARKAENKGAYESK